MVSILLSPDTTTEERHRYVERMIDAYDRALLLLQYSCQSQVLDVLLEDLEDTKHKHNRVNLGSSGIGLLSGLTGMGAVAAQAAAAVTALSVLTPAGPPLLIASIIMGGTAAVTTTGTEAYNHFSQANQMANRIISLHMLVINLLLMVQQLQGDYDDDADTANETTSTATMMTKQQTSSSLSFGREETADMTESEDEYDETYLNETTATSDSGIGMDDDIMLQDEIASWNESKVNTSQTGAYSLEDIDDDANDAHEVVFASVVEESDLKDDSGPKSTDFHADNGNDDDEKNTDIQSEIPKKHSAMVRGAMPLAPLADDAILGMFQLVSRSGSSGNARVVLSRATTNAMKVAQFATIACGALCAATIVMETRNMFSTLKSLKAGSPCEKAQQLRNIRDQLEALPETNTVAKQLKDKILHCQT